MTNTQYQTKCPNNCSDTVARNFWTRPELSFDKILMTCTVEEIADNDKKMIIMVKMMTIKTRSRRDLTFDKIQREIDQKKRREKRAGAQSANNR